MIKTIKNPSNIKIVLASGSPRRKLLLEQVGLNFTVIPPITNEALHDGNNFADTVLHNAGVKTLSVIDEADGLPVLGADTLVDLGGEALGKPSGPAEAVIMLSKLSGKVHRVHTGIVVIDPTSGVTYRDNAMTEVQFRDLTDEEIYDYVSSGDPFDKAGAYGIQGRGALLVTGIKGCFYNVMGLPLSKLWQIMLKIY